MACMATISRSLDILANTINSENKKAIGKTRGLKLSESPPNIRMMDHPSNPDFIMSVDNLKACKARSNTSANKPLNKVTLNKDQNK
jgi:hypothetical protein